MLVFARELITDAVLEELYPLWEAHWQETEMYRSGRKMSPDLARYKQFSEQGFYQLYTARNDEGKMVGDAGMYRNLSMHEQRWSATEDTWYLLPEYRRGRNAIRFLKYVEDQMRAQGCEDVYMSTKMVNGAGRILEYAGYVPCATQYWKDFTKG